MSIARLATRNLLRTPRRTILTTTAVVAGVGVYILGSGFVGGLTENIIAAAIEGTVGHVLARPAGYPAQAGQHPIDKLLQVSEESRSLLDRESVAWTQRTYFAPLASSGHDSLRVAAIGYDLQRDPLVFPRTHWRVTGAEPTGPSDILVTPRVARLLGVSPGGRLVLQVRSHRGAINALEVRVSGVVTTGNIALDLLGIFVPTALTEKLIATNLTSHIAVKLKDRDDASGFASKLAPLLGTQAEVVTWVDETAELIRLQSIREKALDLVMFILMALAALGIANTILMAAHERIREIGTLQAMGMTEGAVLRLFMLEGALMGLLGSVLGAAWGGALVAHWAAHPIDFSEMLAKGQRGSVSASALVYTHIEPSVLVLTMVAGVLVATLASIYPARVASRMVPAEAVRAS